MVVKRDDLFRLLHEPMSKLERRVLARKVGEDLANRTMEKIDAALDRMFPRRPKAGSAPPPPVAPTT